MGVIITNGITYGGGVGDIDAKSVTVDDSVLELGASDVSEALLKLKEMIGDLNEALNKLVTYEDDSEIIYIKIPLLSLSNNESTQN